MKMLVTGAGGQLGSDLTAGVPEGHFVVGLGHKDLDISRPEVIGPVLDVHRPDVLVNCAAFTAVDLCESERDRALEINGLAPGYLAEETRRRGIRFVHISTDYVFNGAARSPYAVDDPIDPRSEYGRSKAEGERRVLAANPEAVIVRTAWVYGPGKNNFPWKILSRAVSNEILRVVDDQRGSPTWSRELAHALWRLSGRRDINGILHWTASGDCTWYEFAISLVEGARRRGVKLAVNSIERISSSAFAAPASRPSYSVLSLDRWNRLFPDCIPSHWTDQMNRYLDWLVRGNPQAFLL